MLVIIRKRFSLLQTSIDDNTFGHVRMYVMPYRFSWTIFILDFGTKLYRQMVGIPMGTNCAPLVADLFLFCYERDFMKYLSNDNQADINKAFNSTSRYLDDLLNIDNPYLMEWSPKFIYLNCNLIKLILQIPRPPFWIYISLFQTALFHPKFMINVMTLILI